MPTPRETILAALHTFLQTLPATTLRGEVLPERVPVDGLLILRDGDALGVPRAAAAELLPIIEAVMVAKLNEQMDHSHGRKTG